MLLLHLVNRVLATLVSLALVAAAVLTAVEVGRWVLDEPAWLVSWRSWGDWLAEVRADDPALVVAAGALALIGLLLLVFELKPRRPDGLVAVPLLPDVHTVVSRKGLSSAATTAARSVSGIASAEASVRRSRIDVTARTRTRDGGQALRERVRTAVEASLADLELQRRPKVRVRLAEES